VRPTVLLFDIDGTLVTTPGVGRRALEQAFAARYGRAGVLQGVQFGGMTDRALVRAGLAVVDEPAEGAAAEAAIDAILAAYVPLLRQEIAETPGLGVQPGVREVLVATAHGRAVAVGLGTGNIRAGARLKLGHVGILDRFAFGGFGCDHEDRIEILRIGAARGASRLGAAVAACRVVVIGDTPRDVAAARAIGAESIGVGTCGFGAAELRESGATYAFADLCDPGVLAALLASR
jgi:phosphoglycolate phosphatase-like HAD superfamily hydrolase